MKNVNFHPESRGNLWLINKNRILRGFLIAGAGLLLGGCFGINHTSPAPRGSHGEEAPSPSGNVLAH